LHFFLGMVLLGPVALEAGSVTYRFYRYYTGSGPYRRKGPPALLLRSLYPLVIDSTAIPLDLVTEPVLAAGAAQVAVPPAHRDPTSPASGDDQSPGSGPVWGRH
jgi:hypothetical protein